MADRIEIKAPTLSVPISVTVSGQDKVDALARSLNNLASGTKLHTYLSDQENMIRRVTDAFEKYNNVSNGKNAVEFVKSFNALKSVTEGLDLSGLIGNYKELDKVYKQLSSDFAKEIRGFGVSDFKDTVVAIAELSKAGADVDQVLNRIGQNANVDQLNSQVSDLTTQVGLLQSRLRDVIAERDNLLNGEEIQRLSEIEYKYGQLKETMEAEFASFLRANDLDTTDASCGKFYEYFEAIRDGSMTAKEAITGVRTELVDLVRQADAGDTIFSSSQMQEFISKLDLACETIELMRSEIEELTNNAGMRAVAQEMSESTELTEKQRAALRGLVEDSDGLNNISQILRALIENFDMTDESVRNATSDFRGMLEALNSLAGADAAGVAGLSKVLENLGAVSKLNVDEEQMKKLHSSLSTLGDLENLHNLAALSAVDLRGFNGIKVSSTINHIATLANNMPVDGAARLKGLGEIDLSNLSAEKFKVSKASFDHLKELIRTINGDGLYSGTSGRVDTSAMDQMADAYDHVEQEIREEAEVAQQAADQVVQAQHAEETAYAETAEAAKAHMQDVEAAARAEDEKKKISELLAEALKKEEEATRKAGNAGEQLGVKINALKEQAKLGKFSSWVEEFYNKVQALNDQTPELQSRMKELAVLAQRIEDTNLSDKQRVQAYQRFNAVLDDTRVKLAAEASTEKDLNATAKELLKILDQSQAVQNKLDNGSFIAFLRTVKADVDGLSVKSVGLTKNVEDLKAAFRDILSAGNIDEQINAYGRWQNAVSGYKATLTADKRASSQADAEATAATKEHTAAVQRLIDLRKELGRLDAEKAGLTAGDAPRLEEITRQTELLQQEYDNLYRSLSGTFTPTDLERLAQATSDATDKVTKKQSEAAAAAQKSADKQAEAAKKAADAQEQAAKRQEDALSAQAEKANKSAESYWNVLQTYQQKVANLKIDVPEDLTAALGRMKSSLYTMSTSFTSDLDKSNAMKDWAEDLALVKSILDSIAPANREVVQAQKEMETSNEAAANKVKNLVEQYAQLGAKTDEVSQKMRVLEEAQRVLNAAPAGTEERTRAEEAFAVAVDDATRAIKQQAEAEKEQEALNAKRTSMLTQLNSMLKQCTDAQQKYALAAKLGVAGDAYKNIQPNITAINDLLDSLRSGEPVTENMVKEFERLKIAVSDTGTALKTTGGFLNNWATTGMSQLRSRLSYTFGLAAMVYKAAGEIKKMISTAVELDTAMNNLQIVTRASSADMDVYAKRVSAMAKETAQATKDLIDASTVYARLGYNTDESATLAKYTAMLQGVGDIEAGAAQDAMTAILKAFDKNVDDVEDVMNKLVVVGNNFPISVSQLAEGMNNAGSMLAVAGNSMEESIALLTAANTTVQNISKSSTGLRTIAARIRKMDTEDGEIIEESKYDKMIQTLTRFNVSLVDANGEYRKTYDIIKDIAKVWDDMNSMQQGAVIEALAGTRQQNVFSSLITQFKEAEGALNSMQDSGGELEEAYGIYLDSIQAHINKLKATFDELSRDVVNSNLAKFLIDALTKIVEALDLVIEKIGILGTVLTGGAIAGVVKFVKSGGLVAALSGISKAFTGFFATLTADAALAGVTPLAAFLAMIPTWVGPAIAAVGALTAATVILVKQWKNAHPNFDQIKKDAKEAEEEFDALRRQIEQNKERIEDLIEIREEGDWTPELQEELTALQAENEELEAQLDLLRDIAKYKGERLAAVTARSIEQWMSVDRSTQLPGGTFLAGQGREIRSEEGYGGMLNDIEDYLELEKQLEDVKQKIADHDYESSSAEELKNQRLDLLDAIVAKETDLLETRKQLVEYRSYLAGRRDEDSVEMIAQLNDVIGELDKAMGKLPKDFKDFKNDLNGLSGSVLKNFLNGVKLTEDELHDFKKWLDLCGYSADQAADFFNEYIQELNTPAQPADSHDATIKRIGDLTSLRDELEKTTTAIEAYNEAMKGGEKGDIVKDIAEIYKGAMEDIKSGRIDSNRVNALAELLFSPEQLAAWGFDIARVGREMQSEMLQAMFDPAGDSKKSYGQRFAEYIRETFGNAADIGVKDLGNGRYEFYYDNIEHLARAVGMSDEVVAAFLDDLDAYGVEVMMSADDTAELIEKLQLLEDTLGGKASKRTVAEEFAKQLAEGGRNAMQIGKILENLRRNGALNISDDDIVNAIEVAKGVISEKNKNELLDVNGAKLSLQDLRTFFDELFKEPAKAEVDVALKGAEEVKQELHNLNAGVGAEDEAMEDTDGLDAYRKRLKDLYNILGDLSNETGSVKTATKILVDMLRQSGMTDDGIQGMLDGLRSMGSAYIPTLQELDAEASSLNSTLDELDSKDVTPNISVDTSAAYRAMNNVVSDLNSMSQRTWTVRLGVDTYGTARQVIGVSQSNKLTGTGKIGYARAAGGKTGVAGDVLVNELGPELISDKGRAFVANSGEPGFVHLSKDAVVFTAEETEKIFGKQGRRSLIDRLLRGGTGAAASGTASLIKAGASKVTTTTTTKTTTTTTTAGKTASTKTSSVPQYTGNTPTSSYWTCSKCGFHNTNMSRTTCVRCGAARYANATTSLVSAGVSKGTSAATSSAGKSAKSAISSYSGQGYGLEDLFSYGDKEDTGKGGGGGGGSSQSETNPSKRDWIEVRLNRLQRAIQDLEKVASSGLKKLTTRLTAATDEVSKLNEEISAQQQGYDRYIQEAESVGLRSDLATKVRNGTIDINEYDDETQQLISEYEEWLSLGHSKTNLIAGTP